MAKEAISGKIIKAARESRGKKHIHLAELLEKSQGYISKIENNKIDGGIKGHELLLISSFLEYDPRVFSGELSLEEGDLKTKKNSPTIERLEEKIDELNIRVNPISKLDHVAERVMANSDLYEIAKTIMYLDGSILKNIKNRILGYLECLEDRKKSIIEIDDDAKKEKTA